MRIIIFFQVFLFLFNVESYTQEIGSYDLPSRGNPIIPGYFADPTVKKIGDTYYLYATTDGNGGGFGPSQVWTSKDFVNWAIQPMNWPNTHWYWAPDMTKGYDGRYYLYYSQPVELFGAVSDSPVGPWTSLVPDDKAFVPNYLIPGVITLDGQTFTDDDGKIYMFWGTWGIYPGHGCAVGLLNDDMKSFEKIELIPNTIAKDFFEAPIMFKRNGMYYLMYSSGHCEDHTYRVQYLRSTKGPFGPYEYSEDNPILVTNADGTIHGPGHNGIIEKDGKYFIVYHRHNNPHSGGGFHRQIAMDELFFDDKGWIKKVKPTHEGVDFKDKNSRPFRDLAFGKKVTASSFYSKDFRPEFAVDNNNGTLWRAVNNTGAAWLQVDLGSVQSFGTVLLEMEYPTYAYQFIIETSNDGQLWEVFADQRNNDRWASPIICAKEEKARYVRCTIANVQHVGLPRGIWNLKIYREDIDQVTIWSDPQVMPKQDNNVNQQLFRLEATHYGEGKQIRQLNSKGSLTGQWESTNPVLVKFYQGKKAIYLDGHTILKSTFEVPESLSGNASYTVSMWVNNPKVERNEPILSWSSPGNDLTLATFGFGNDPARGVVSHGGWANMSFSTVPSASAWQHIVITFDGYMERIYVNGTLQTEQNKMLFVRRAKNFLIGGMENGESFSGYISSLELDGRAWSATDISAVYQREKESELVLSLESADLGLGKSEALTIYDSATNLITLKDVSVEVNVWNGRMGVRVPAYKDPFLDKLLERDEWLLELDVFIAKDWKHILVVKEGGKFLFFENGKQVNMRINDIYRRNGDSFIWQVDAIHSLRLHEKNESTLQVSTLFKSWQEKRNLSANVMATGGTETAYRINGKQLFVQIAPTSTQFVYEFIYGDRQSAWLSSPYCSFIYQPKADVVRVRNKDLYGNVTSFTAITVDKQDPEKITFQGLVEVYDFSEQNSIPFWDGRINSLKADSTATEIRYEDGIWTLGSKDTKWGNAEFVGPFLFKELTGNFTIEVLIDDVAGLSVKTRTSSEAGIMIQDTQNPSAYLNNTILTGWNLGNLTRSVGNRTHQEGNTGEGLNFDPYLQVQKVGELFYLRSSSDGHHWKNLPNSPFERPDLVNKQLKVGIYQTANNNQYGYGKFKDIVVWKNRAGY